MLRGQLRSADVQPFGTRMGSQHPSHDVKSLLQLRTASMPRSYQFT